MGAGQPMINPGGSIANALMQSYTGFPMNPRQTTPYAAYSQMPGIPQGHGMSPVQAAQFGSQYNPAWGSQYSQLPLGDAMGQIGRLLQTLVIPKALDVGSKLTGLPPEMLRMASWNGSGNLMPYEFTKAMSMGTMEMDMLMGRGAFRGHSLASLNPAAAQFANRGMLGTLMTNMIGSEYNAAGMIGMREMAPYMTGTLVERGMGVARMVRGLGESGAGAGGYYDGRKTHGVGLGDLTYGIGLASRFGMSGLTEGDLEGIGSPVGSAANTRSFGRVQDLAGIISAGRGILGRNATPGQVLTMAADVFGENSMGNPAEVQKRLVSVQAMAERANVDAKFVGEYVKVMRRMGENMGMYGDTAANYALKTTEAAIQTQAAARRGGVALTLDQAARYSGASAASGVGSGMEQWFEGMQVAWGQFSPQERRRINLRGGGTGEDFWQKMQAVLNYDSRNPESRARANQAWSWIDRNGNAGNLEPVVPGYRSRIGMGLQGYLSDDDLGRSDQLRRNGGRSLAGTMADGFDMSESDFYKRSKYIKNEAMLSPLALVLQNRQGSLASNMEGFFRTDAGKAYRASNPYLRSGQVGAAEFVRDISDTSRSTWTLGSPASAMDHVILLAGNERRSAEARMQSEIEVKRELINAVGGIHGNAGLMTEEGIANVMNGILSSTDMPELRKALGNAPIWKEGDPAKGIDKKKFEEWRKSKEGTSLLSKATASILASGRRDAANLLGLDAADLGRKFDKDAESIGSYNGTEYSAKGFSDAIYSKLSDPEARAVAMRKFAESVYSRQNGGKEMSVEQGRAMEEAIKAEAQSQSDQDNGGEVSNETLASRVIDALKPLVKIENAITRWFDGKINPGAEGKPDPQVDEYTHS